MSLKRFMLVIIISCLAIAVPGLATPLPTSAEEVKMENLSLIPGGDSVGIELNTNGVVIMGKNPEAPAGFLKKVKEGDIIKKADGHSLSNVQQLSSIIQKAGKKERPLSLEMTRGSDSFEASVRPYQNESSDYAIGLYVKDKISGIGTLTFTNPKDDSFGALGHVIRQPGIANSKEVDEGTIARSNVTSIRRGEEGMPGEKHAEFDVSSDKMGVVSINSSFGVFGKLNKKDAKLEERSALPVKRAADVKKGPAKIRTVVEGDKIEEYDIEIVENNPDSKPSTKGLVIKITDERLLEQTGGIVQGMSGSPIIQDDHIVGAVTHVFVNDSTSGYGVHIEWMIEESMNK
ncbi:SpoIVB peptidase [Salimicrobium halophilum]|uniref:SpoIVB peptidase. Serine peptidase. MEROPS family S55 n=1 Tax=Salimicrobium halophilum TaxID=86666 RepID=A0A1G8PVC5_9BACI|nr:SpoIVB peptidase [Salimicrobium halophilum]SDI96402.1 SpoIVB peptidase. Serine peptidase. MEROPS family S55 [Salimicrobium halophilum]